VLDSLPARTFHRSARRPRVPGAGWGQRPRNGRWHAGCSISLMARTAHLEGTDRGLFTPSMLLPEQYFAPQRRPLTGSQRLMAAVLEDAVALMCRRDRTERPQTGREMVLMRNTERWFRADDEKWVFSFLRICEALDLNPAYLRRMVLRRALPRRGTGRLAARMRGPSHLSVTSTG
jgi:hypothetical protein